MLMYADDIVLFANSETELQKLHDNLSVIDVNTSKTKICIYERK